VTDHIHYYCVVSHPDAYRVNGYLSTLRFLKFVFHYESNDVHGAVVHDGDDDDVNRTVSKTKDQQEDDCHHNVNSGHHVHLHPMTANLHLACEPLCLSVTQFCKATQSGRMSHLRMPARMRRFGGM